MTDLIIPTVGSSGYYQLRSPLDNLIIANQRYTCKAVRNISDYLANNEDIKADIYSKYSIPDTEYDQDILDDAYIVSLQSEEGHWIYIPARYIISYPITNGIPYRSIMVGISLPSLPVDRDLSFLETDIINLVSDSLGVVPVIRKVETSPVVLVSRERHDIVQAERDMLSAGRVTDRSRYIKTLQDLNVALDKIQQLEQYIKDNLIP